MPSCSVTARARRRRAAFGLVLAYSMPGAWSAAGAEPALAVATPTIVIGRIGQSPLEIVRAAQANAMASALRARWMAGHAALPAAGTLALTGGTVASASVVIGNPQSYPIIQFGYTSGVAGFAAATFIFTSPSGAQSYAAGYTVGPYRTQGTTEFASVAPLSLAAQPGDWTLSSAAIYDHAGNTQIYTSTQLATLFKNSHFTVVNTGPADAVLPQVQGAAILTKTVSLSSPRPAFETSITASDKGGAGLYNEYVFVSPPGFQFAYAGIYPLAMPENQGTVTTYDPVIGYGVPGTWGIYGYAVCDFESNCTQSNSPADVRKLFGTNIFTVTQ